MHLTTVDGKARTVDSEVLWRKDGTSVPVEYSTTPVRKAGALVGTVVVYRDITERKAGRAGTAAREAGRGRGDAREERFPRQHEPRDPYADERDHRMSHLALQTELDKKQRNYVEKAHRAATNLLGIINDILDFSKIEAGKMAIEKIDFRLEDVMDNLASLVGMKAEDRGLELLYSAAADVPTALVGDPCGSARC
jgi:signal transduction histidine kinase